MSTETLPTDSPETDASANGFKDLGLTDEVQKAVEKSGYETPSDIQAETIPYLLDGRDVIGQAQTGTGKTAAFALPILSRIDRSNPFPQVLVLAPTRELAIQVAESFETYSKFQDGVSVLPVYGGQDYSIQLRALRRGVQIVVGTPGRVMDHMRRGTLKLDQLKCLVLDEADEMLRMGFVDDVEWILTQIPDERQIALFSATMPAPIRRIADTYLNDPVKITIKTKTQSASTIRQRYLISPYRQKPDALMRILEAEDVDGAIVFVRTKSVTVELADELTANGYSATALNGDIPQKLRERTIDQLKAGRIDIVVATDVAARGLDVERISHVINFDLPHDSESYIHRIGRTGRAGREGDAILFVTPKERHQLKNIERVTRQKIEKMEPPRAEQINAFRVERFKKKITKTLSRTDKGPYEDLIESYLAENEATPEQVAVALAMMAQGDTPLQIQDKPKRERYERDDSRSDRGGRNSNRGERSDRGPRPQRRDQSKPEEGMESFRIEVGFRHGVKPGNIVGAIANEAELDSKYIGRINIQDDHSFIDLPEGMPGEVFDLLQDVYVSGQPMKIKKSTGPQPPPRERGSRGPSNRGHGGGGRSSGGPRGGKSGSKRRAPERRPRSNRGGA